MLSQVSEFMWGQKTAKVDSHKVLGVSDIHISPQARGIPIKIRYSPIGQKRYQMKNLSIFKKSYRLYKGT